MVTFTKLSNSVRIDTDGKSSVFPTGKLITITSDDSTSVTLRLVGSRKNIMSFPYTDCNLAAEDAPATAKKIAEIL